MRFLVLLVLWSKTVVGFFISLKVVVSLSVSALQSVNLVAKLELPSPLSLH